MKSVWSKYVKEERVTVNALPLNSQSKIHQKRVPISKMILCQIREFIRNRLEIREHVVARDITILQCSLGYIDYFLYDSFIMRNDVCSVQHYPVCK